MIPDPLEAGAELLRGQDGPFLVAAIDEVVVLQAREEFSVVAAMFVVGY